MWKVCASVCCIVWNNVSLMLLAVPYSRASWPIKYCYGLASTLYNVHICCMSTWVCTPEIPGIILGLDAAHMSLCHRR